MYLADLHIHSKYSRATSRDCDAPHLDYWARRKGIGLLGTGDFTHPVWRAELTEQLIPAEEGLYRLKDEYRLPGDTAGEEVIPRFVVSGEISCIYKKAGRVRKVHCLILLPGLEAGEELAHRLEAIGNIHSDGRPILGLDCRDLLEITLNSCPEAVFIPAHIWTPHFSLFGAFSRFETMQECFGDLTPWIHAVETGLSSDPPMNWRVSALDDYTLVSNSDAHSPGKLGREANLLDAGLSYPALAHAIQTGEGFAGTIEFFPEEGKYHWDGHRNCGVCLSPQEALALDGKCPVCGKRLTIGVEHRVEELADRTDPPGAGRKPFESLVPLPEVIGSAGGCSPGSVRATECYDRMLRSLGTEFAILRETPLEEIESTAGEAVAESIRRLRQGRVERRPGYDGEYGKVILLSREDREQFGGQTSLLLPKAAQKPAPREIARQKPRKSTPLEEKMQPAPETLNEEQLCAAASPARITAVTAGPGTGKTKTLTARAEWLVTGQGAKPGEIAAVTFTIQAAKEMSARLEQRLGKRKAKAMIVGTFHAICRKLLGGGTVISLSEAKDWAEQALRETETPGQPDQLLEAVSRRKNGLAGPEEGYPEAEAYYCRLLTEVGLMDFDDLLLGALRLEGKPPFAHLLVDEFQDCAPLQRRLLQKWSEGAQSLFVIGDPDQSIYSFRGADAGCFDRLKADFPDAEMIRLSRNYRSTPQILSCGLSVIGNNPGGVRELVPQRPAGGKVRCVRTENGFSEGVFIAKEIGRMTGGMDMLESQQGEERQAYRSFSEIAVLCRTHRQLEVIEKCLRHDSIPCIIAGREDFLEKPEIRGVLGFFRFLLEGDPSSLRAALKYGFDCPPDLIDRAENRNERTENSPAVSPPEPLKKFWETAALFQPLCGSEKPRKLLERWAGEAPLTDSMERLMNMAVFYERMPDFLDRLLAGQEGDLQRASGRYDSGAVRLMTFHGAKGLEFPAVFLAGVAKGILPLTRKEETDWEEERRLFYVGITRAREELILTVPGEDSPFLEELPSGSLTWETGRMGGHAPEEVQLRLF